MECGYRNFDLSVFSPSPFQRLEHQNMATQ
jgi:hypothetical protein